MTDDTPPPVVPKAPYAYFEDGYLVLALSTRNGEVHYFSTREGGKGGSMSFPNFSLRMRPAPEVNPYRLMLNIISQDRLGILRVRAKDERKMVNILRKSQEELQALSLEQLGHEYARIVKKKPPPAHEKDRLVKELLMNLEHQVQEAEKKEGGTTEPAAPVANQPAAAPESGKEKPVTTKKAKTKKEPAKKAAAPKETKKKETNKKEPAKKAAPVAKKAKSKESPFREGSMKAKLYTYFKECGGDRAKVLAKAENLGATEATAKSWYAVFCRL